MKNFLLLASLTLAVCLFAKAEPVGDPANKGTAAAEATSNSAGGDKAKEQLRKVLSAFATNDEATGRKLAQEFLGMQGLVAPQQIQAVQLLLRITNPPTLKDESPDEAKIRAEAIKVAADLNTTLAQLNKIEAIAATMPKSGFTQGGQTHQRWIQLGNDRGRLWGEKEKLVKRQRELSAEYATAHSARLSSVETQLLDLASRFAEQGDIEAALAFCNTYLRKNPSAQNVAKKGQELFEQKGGQPRGQGLAGGTSAPASPPMSDLPPSRVTSKDDAKHPSMTVSSGAKGSNFDEDLKSAMQGDPKAQSTIARMYNLGLGSPPGEDRVKGFQWAVKAAEQGSRRDQTAIASQYITGLGVPKDEIKGLAWAIVAVASPIEDPVSSQEAKEFVDYMAFSESLTTPEDLDKAHKLANDLIDQLKRHHDKQPLHEKAEGAEPNGWSILWLEERRSHGASEVAETTRLLKAAESGDADAQNKVGNAYLVGEGVDRDETKATAWIEKAAVQGNVHAQSAIGKMYSIGKLVPQDKVKAFQWQKKAAEQGSRRDQSAIAWKYFNRTGPKDMVQGLAWIYVAAAPPISDPVAGRIPGLKKMLDETCVPKDFEKLMTPEEVNEAQKLSKDLIEQIKRQQDGRPSRGK